MPHHELKICPRCGITFECKVGSINLCQCSAIVLSQEERDYIFEQYSDCLCAACLIEMQIEHQQKGFEERSENVLRNFHLKLPKHDD